MRVVAITGTPATGKTTISKKLAKRLDYHYLDVNKLISEHKLFESYDRKRKTKIVDIKKLNKNIIKLLKQLKKQGKTRGIIIDSHLSHYLPKKYVDFCIVTKCSIKELNKRLNGKKFHKSKIQENLQAEIFDICYNESIEMGHNAIMVDTTKGFNISALANRLGWSNVSRKGK